MVVVKPDQLQIGQTHEDGAPSRWNVNLPAQVVLPSHCQIVACHQGCCPAHSPTGSGSDMTRDPPKAGTFLQNRKKIQSFTFHVNIMYKQQCRAWAYHLQPRGKSGYTLLTLAKRAVLSYSQLYPFPVKSFKDSHPDEGTCTQSMVAECVCSRVISSHTKTNLCGYCLSLLTGHRRCGSFFLQDSVEPHGSWKRTSQRIVKNIERASVFSCTGQKIYLFQQIWLLKVKENNESFG